MEKKQPPIFGQWIGEFSSKSPIDGKTNVVLPGSAIFNIEYDRPDKGFALIDQGMELHGSRKDFEIKIEGNRISGRGTITRGFDWQTNETISIDESVKRLKSRGKDLFYIGEPVVS